MNYFLAKSEPAVYSIADLERDGSTVWDGIKNPQAMQAVKSMHPSDRVFIYHSGGESRIVGIAQVVSEARPDPKNDKLWVVELKFLHRIDPPPTLAEIKQSELFNDWALVRQSRLSTMAVPEKFIAWMGKRYPALKF